MKKIKVKYSHHKSFCFPFYIWLPVNQPKWDCAPCLLKAVVEGIAVFKREIVQHIMAETSLQWFSSSEPDLGNTIPIKDQWPRLAGNSNQKALEGSTRGCRHYYQTLPSLEWRQAPASQCRSWTQCSWSPIFQLFLWSLLVPWEYHVPDTFQFEIWWLRIAR